MNKPISSIKTGCILVYIIILLMLIIDMGIHEGAWYTFLFCFTLAVILLALGFILSFLNKP